MANSLDGSTLLKTTLFHNSTKNMIDLYNNVDGLVWSFSRSNTTYLFLLLDVVRRSVDG